MDMKCTPFKDSTEAAIPEDDAAKVRLQVTCTIFVMQ